MADLSAIWREDASEEEVIDAYQDLINSGQAWWLEGHVGRIREGRSTNEDA